MSQDNNMGLSKKPYTVEETECNFCGSQNHEIVFRRRDLNTNLPGLFTVVKCNNCGLLYLNPKPTSKSIIEDIYPAKYDQYLFEDSPNKLRKRFQNYGFQKRINYISKFKSGGHILDVGCATGDFLRYLQESQFNWEVSGLEPVQEAARAASKRLGVEVRNSFLADSDFKSASFDVVTFWHVFEHLEDPMGSLIETHRILKDKGFVVITLPMTNSIDHKIFSKYWIGYELPRHLFFFSKEKMKQYLKKAGFKTIDDRNLYGSHAMTMTSIKFWLLGKFNVAEKTANRIFGFLMSPFSRLLFAPLFFILDKFGLSTPVTFVAQKI